jgi:hypothetical protein
MATRDDPWAYWARHEAGPFTPAHQARRALSIHLANLGQDLRSLVPPPWPPFALTDAALAASVTHGDHARANSILASSLWAMRDVSRSHRFLAEQVRDEPRDATLLMAAFDLLDALAELDVELSQRPKVFWERTRALTVSLQLHHSHADGTSTWWLAALASSVHHRAIAQQRQVPPLSEWLAEIPQALPLAEDANIRRIALALGKSVLESPTTLLRLAASVA